MTKLKDIDLPNMRMNSRVIILMLSLIPFRGVSQSISGVVNNQSTGKPIPYATVGLVTRNNGASADSLGYFHLRIPGSQGDSVRFSSVGYRSRVIFISEPTDSLHVALEELPQHLPAVSIRSHTKATVLERFRNCGQHWFTLSGGLTQIAKPFHADAPGFVLSKISVCKQGSNSFFRVRVYAVDSITGGPGEDLTGRVIEVRSRRRNVEVDLSGYFIYPQQDFFIAIEWLFVEENITYDKILGRRKGSSFSYQPWISISSEKQDSWIQSFRGRWRKSGEHKFLISVELKY